MNAPSVHTTPVHARHPFFKPDEHGMLHINGVPLPLLAERVGGTPFYAVDRSAVAARVRELRAVLPPAVRLHYAMKANPMPALVGYLVGLVDGVDLASAGEMQVALNAGANPADTSLAGPGKRPAELRQAVAAGVLVSVESATELPHLAQASQDLGVPARVALRLNPDFELKGAGMRMGGGAKPFGVDVDQAPGVLRQMGALAPMGLVFEGFHIYAGSQNLRADALVQAQQLSYELVLRLQDAVPAPVRHVNLGGGFGIPYFPGEQPLDVAPIGAALHGLVERAARELPQAQLVLELGRYLVGEAGVYVCRVLDRKVSGGQVFLVVDGGLHHHLAASGNFGQVIRRNYPVVVCGGNAGSLPREVVEAAEQGAAHAALSAADRLWDASVTVVGPLCTPLDMLADRMPLPHAEVGAWMVVLQSGGYGLSASPQGFLGHPNAAEALV
jgi:diaminopimelate decarboxylase